MKTITDYSFKIPICILALFLINCHNEGTYNETEPSKKSINVTIQPWDHFKIEKSRIAENLKTLIRKNTTSRITESEVYDFFIDENRVQIIEQEHFTTYTFLVQRDSMLPNILENYSYKAYPDGDYEQYLIKYHFTTDENGDKEFNPNFVDIELIEDSNLLMSRDNCVPEFIEVVDEIVCTYNARCTGPGNHEFGDPQCLCTPEPHTCDPPLSTTCNTFYVLVYQGCGGLGGNDDDSGDGDYDPNDESSGGNSSGGNNNPDDETIGVPFDDPTPIWQPTNNCINGLMPFGQADNTTLDISIFEESGLSLGEWTDINNYLEDNNCSEEAQQEVIDEIYDILDEQIIIDSTFENHERLNCVFEKFKMGSNSISKYLKNFEPEFSVAHLELSADNNFELNYPDDTAAGAITLPPDNYLIEIVFNIDSDLSSSAQNFPTIVLALELIHEMIHAEMFRKLLSSAGISHLNYQQMTVSEWTNFFNNIRNDFPGLFDYFVRYKYGETAEITDEQHEQMAQHYRIQVVLALREFDNNQSPLIDYEALAWIGLKDTVAWNNLTEAEQISINNKIQNITQNYTHECNN